MGLPSPLWILKNSRKLTIRQPLVKLLIETAAQLATCVAHIAEDKGVR
ncbi:hypothetical protein GDS87_24590 (plasmid) [Lysinibacillus pakistanensis]|uniref:Uncharacterized protein n=1 Tax=Lysinibacillus pakistanensis TaxID=759811 RepID=A0ABX6DHI3_9BACI|nr:hypothetical protein GDS87_24590 [Lysinibacillus pakistanensis]